MSSFRNEMAVIPTLGRWLAAAVYLVLATVIFLFVLPAEREPAAWPVWGKALVTMLAPLPLAVFVLLVAYIYGDAKRRGMNHRLWTLLALFVPNAIGIILYFILRQPLMLPCPSCGKPARRGFGFCPHCGGQLGRICPQCHRGVELAWSHCARCGARLASA